MKTIISALLCGTAFGLAACSSSARHDYGYYEHPSYETRYEARSTSGYDQNLTHNAAEHLRSARSALDAGDTNAAKQQLHAAADTLRNGDKNGASVNAVHRLEDAFTALDHGRLSVARERMEDAMHEMHEAWHAEASGR